MMRFYPVVCAALVFVLSGCTPDTDDVAYCLFLGRAEVARELGVHAIGPSPSDPGLRAIQGFFVNQYPELPRNQNAREFNGQQFDAAVERCTELRIRNR